MTTRREESRKVFDRHHEQKKEKLALQLRVGKAFEQVRKSVFTYTQLKAYLDNMSAEQLAQQVQLLGPGGSITDHIMLEPVIAVGTVAEMCSDKEGSLVQETRSSLDFKCHPEEVVLLSDYSGFGEDGDTCYTMTEDEEGEPVLIGNVSGKVKPWVKRKRCEPSIKASRSKAMDSQYPELSDKALENWQEDLARKSVEGCLTREDTDNLAEVQAELYRRIYHLSTKEEYLAIRPQEEAEIDKYLDEEVDG